MAKVYVKLKDKGTTFYDIEQQAGVVASRTEELHLTAKVREWIRKGNLVEVEADEAKATIKEQTKAREAHKADAPVKETKAEAKATKAELELAGAEATYKYIFKEDAPKDSTVASIKKALDEKEEADKVAIHSAEYEKLHGEAPDAKLTSGELAQANQTKAQDLAKEQSKEGDADKSKKATNALENLG